MAGDASPIFFGFYLLKRHFLRSRDLKSVCEVGITSEVYLNSQPEKKNVLYSSNPYDRHVEHFKLTEEP